MRDYDAYLSLEIVIRSCAVFECYLRPPPVRPFPQCHLPYSRRFFCQKITQNRKGAIYDFDTNISILLSRPVWDQIVCETSVKHILSSCDLILTSNFASPGSFSVLSGKVQQGSFLCQGESPETTQWSSLSKETWQKKENFTFGNKLLHMIHHKIQRKLKFPLTFHPGSKICLSDHKHNFLFCNIEGVKLDFLKLSSGNALVWKCLEEEK